jgi:glucose-6-phosphate dehydrogenase assembly protein OpcA
VIHEAVEIDCGPEHLEALQTIVDPVLVGEIPTVVWSPHGHEDAVKALLGLMDVVLVDSDDLPEPADAFERVESLREHAYVVDLAWLRTTPWRERLAASFDLPSRLAVLHHISALEVRHQERSTASGLLLAGWMASRLQWDRARLSGGLGLFTGALTREDGEVIVELRALEQESPGLIGVTVSCDEGTSLALQRGYGGLDAAERNRNGEQREWKILGASRGEGGILGEGVRQALLRDPTYVGALDAARELCPV